jgi:hypothetical protein
VAGASPKNTGKDIADSVADAAVDANQEQHRRSGQGRRELRAQKHFQVRFSIASFENPLEEG